MISKATIGVIEFGEQILHLLEHTRTSATYKYAVLLAMMDLCIARKNRHGDTSDSITTVQLAEKVMELYWSHTLPMAGRNSNLILKQNSGPKGAVILTRIGEYKAEVFGNTTSFSRAKSDPEFQEKFIELRNIVEQTLIRMPLPKLQRLGRESTALLYTISWDDNITECRVRKYQEGKPSADFNNLIHFKPNVPDYLVTLSGLLRPLIHRNWASMVARLNKKHFKNARLEEFLFGANRVPLTPVTRPIREIHNDRCFYCEKTLSKSCHVDHFIPWARYPDNGIANLVAAHSACNGNKSDFLASHHHVEKWLRHIKETKNDRLQLAKKKSWTAEINDTLGVAQSIYLHISPSTLLWESVDNWIQAEPERIGRIFEGFVL